MDRLTKRNEKGCPMVDSDAREEAIQRLARFEDAYENLMESQMQIPKELEKLRAAGKEKTVRYKEMLAQKLINNNIINFFEKHGIT